MKTERIRKVEIFNLDLPVDEPFRIAIGTFDTWENTVLRIHTDSGLCGTGEAAPAWMITGETRGILNEALKAMAKLLIGKDPFDIESRMKELNTYIVHNTTAKSAIDNALYDLLARRAGLPLYALLGGCRKELTSNMTLGIDTPERMAGKAKKYIEAGTSVIKVKLGDTREGDVQRIAAIRDRIGPDIRLRIDANQGWDEITARDTLADLGQFDIDYCEQPVAWWNHDALKRLRASSPIPIMADESVHGPEDAHKLAAAGAVDYFNIKIAKTGGIRRALAVNAVAESAGIRCMIGSMKEIRFGLTVSSHFAAACENVHFVDLEYHETNHPDPVIGGITFRGNIITLPDGPGIGADFDQGALEPVATVE